MPAPTARAADLKNARRERGGIDSTIEQCIARHPATQCGDDWAQWLPVALRHLDEARTRNHSGLEIDKGRGNALKILTRILMDVAGMGARLARIDGGSKRNAIPREARAVVVVPSARLADVQQAIVTWQAMVKSELGSVEQELAICSAPVAGANPGVLKEGDQRRITGHTPDERIHIDTVPKFYAFVLGILKNVR
jgi:di/tripeptidase